MYPHAVLAFAQLLYGVSQSALVWLQVAVYKCAAGQELGAEAVVRSCIARVPPGYARIEVDLLDDPMWGSDGWDT